MDRNLVLTNFVSNEDLTGKEFYALGSDYGLCDTDGGACFGIIYQVGKNVGDTSVAVVGGDTYAHVLVKAGENINAGDPLTTSAAATINGAEVNGLLKKWTPTVDASSTNTDEPVKGGFPMLIALEGATADASNDTDQLIRVRFI